MDYKEKIATLKSRNTIIEMLTDRGYDVPEYYKINMEKFTAMYENNNIDIYIEGIDKKVFVKFYKELKSLGKNDLKTIVSNARETYTSDDLHIIIVFRDKYSASVGRELLNSYYKNVELFLQKNLLFNITKNYLVPTHILLSDNEKENVLKKYNCKISQLPKILHTDPVAAYYGMKSGDVCKIIRTSSSAGEAVSYRYVR